MKRVEITKGRGRLYYDPETGHIRIDYGGVGPGMDLTREERTLLSKALWYSPAR